MENLTLEAVTKQINDAGEALKKKAKDAENLAQKAWDNVEKLLSQKDEALSKEDAQIMQKQLDALELKMKHFGMTNKDQKPESLEESFMKAYKPVAEEIEKLKASNEKLKVPLKMELKAVDVISLASTISNVASSGQVTISEFTGIISPIRQRILTYLRAVSTGAISTQFAVWVEEYDEEGNPIFIGEGVTKPGIDVQYKEQRAKVEKIAVHMKVTTEILEDATYLLSYIQTNGLRRVQTAIENQLFTGNGTSPQLQGLIPKATDFNGGGLAGSVRFATNWDVVNALISQCKAANGECTGIFVANSELHKMLSTKDEDGQYILPAGVLINAQGQVSAWGVPLIGTNALNGGGDDFVGGDLTTINVRLRSGITVEIGRSGDDFIDNLQTIVIEQRLVQFISENDTPVLVKGSFDAAVATLQTI